MTRLVVEALTVERGGRPVISDISFTLAAGRLMTVLGANGAGKSTLLRAVAGLLPVSRGRRLWDGNEDAVGEEVHYLGHLDALKPALSVAANLHLWAAISGRPGLHAIEALEAVGLDHLDDMPAGYLSAGQRRRVALARLLLVERPLWLLDEPTAALDAAAEATFGELLARHIGKGGLAIAATHRPLPLAAHATLSLGTEQ